MEDIERQRLADIVRHIITGFDAVRRDLRRMGCEPSDLDLAVSSLREASYSLLAESTMPEQLPYVS